MSTGLRVPLDQGAATAQRLMSWLDDACVRIEVAGSIRRGRPDVGDIELVAIPRRVNEPEGMFETAERNLLTECIDSLVVRGVLHPHPDDPKRGERYSKLIEASGLQVDLFSAAVDSFGLIMLIRTGPADYSRRFVTDLRSRGLHVSGGRLHRGGLGCGSYVCEPVPTPEESDVYHAAGWPYIAPANR